MKSHVSAKAKKVSTLRGPAQLADLQGTFCVFPQYPYIRYYYDTHNIWDSHSNFCCIGLKLLYVLREGKPKTRSPARFVFCVEFHETYVEAIMQAVEASIKLPWKRSWKQSRSFHESFRGSFRESFHGKKTRKLPRKIS